MTDPNETISGRVIVRGPDNQDIVGNKTTMIVPDDYGFIAADMTDLETRLMANLTGEEYEEYKRDPKAYLEYLRITMTDGPQFSIMDKPFTNPYFGMDLAYDPIKEEPSFPTPTKNWVKSRYRSYGKAYIADMLAKKTKRLAKRANDKANRKRARNGRR